MKGTPRSSCLFSWSLLLLVLPSSERGREEIPFWFYLCPQSLPRRLPSVLRKNLSSKTAREAVFLKKKNVNPHDWSAFVDDLHFIFYEDEPAKLVVRHPKRTISLKPRGSPLRPKLRHVPRETWTLQLRRKIIRAAYILKLQIALFFSSDRSPIC